MFSFHMTVTIYLYMPPIIQAFWYYTFYLQFVQIVMVVYETMTTFRNRRQILLLSFQCLLLHWGNNLWVQLSLTNHVRNKEPRLSLVVFWLHGLSANIFHLSLWMQYECCWFPGHKHNYQTDLWHDRLKSFFFNCRFFNPHYKSG